MPARKTRANVHVDETEIHNEPLSSAECLCMGMGPQVSAVLKMGSSKTREHFRTARIEFLKGVRTLLDERIESLSKEAPSKKGAKIAVD